MDRFITQEAQQNKILGKYQDTDRILMEATRKMVKGPKLSLQLCEENEICVYHP